MDNASMVIGLLGCDRRIVELLTAAVADGARVALACDVPDEQVASLASAGLCDRQVSRAGTWESLVDARLCDCVFVGSDGWNEARAEAVRRLVQAGRQLVLSHPLELSMLWAYEIDMIRGDSNAVLVPDLPDRLHPFISRLRGLVEAALAGAAPLGGIDAIVMQRCLAVHDHETVLRAFCRDADLLRAVAGDPKRLSTLGATPQSASFATLAVELNGPANIPVRWQVVRADRPSANVALLCERGTATVDIPDAPADAWTFRESRSDGTRPVEDSLAFDRSRAVLSNLSDSLHRTSPRNAPHGDAIPPASWADAARAIELAETVPRSIAKGRGIDLHQEEFSEIGTFKGTMASLGCGIVLAGLFLLMLATLLGGIAKEAGWEFGERIAGAWPWIVLTVLVVFLALQIIPLLIGQSSTGRPRRPD